ncbi:endonuclease domain-containing protein [Oerskovia turbata]
MPRPLPPRPFLVSVARAAGVSRHALAADALHTPVRGVRMDASLQADRAALCVAIQLALPPGAAFSHTTAAGLWRLPLPRHLDDAAPVHVSGPRGAVPLDGERVVSHSGLRPGEAEVLRGLRVTTRARTWLDLAALPGHTPGRGPTGGPAPSGHRQDVSAQGGLAHDDLVVLTDALLGGWRPAATRAELAAILATHTGRRGVARLRAALASARSFVDSPMETRVRLQLIASGFPCPVVGADVFHQDRWVARPDLCWPRLRIAIEYDGRHHLTDRQQMLDDVARREEMERLGWRVLVLYADDVLRRWPATTGRVMQAFADRGVDPRRVLAAPDVTVRPRVVER